MNLPTQVTIGGKKVRISYVDSLPEGDSGYSEPTNFIIKISKSANATPEVVFSTLFHEILHIALGITGHSEALKKGQEEAIVYGLENMLAGIFVFRPDTSMKYREIVWPGEDE